MVGCECLADCLHSFWNEAVKSVPGKRHIKFAQLFRSINLCRQAKRLMNSCEKNETRTACYGNKHIFTMHTPISNLEKRHTAPKKLWKKNENWKRYQNNSAFRTACERWKSKRGPQINGKDTHSNIDIPIWIISKICPLNIAW